MVTIAVVGLGSFGTRVIDELTDSDAEIIIVDKDRAVVEKYKDKARDAYITDAINNDMLKKIIPEDVDAVIIDLGSQLETSILVTNYLHKMGVKHIVAKARSDEHGEILKLVGATMVVYPDLDAAQRITPMLISSVLFNYMQVSSLFALAEVAVRPELENKTLAESKIRQTFKLNVVAFRNDNKEDFKFISNADFTFTAGMHILVAGTETDIHGYLNQTDASDSKKHRTSFRKLFSRK
ncbi:MAG: TrkA family potassium uptake protein [Treponema sp.]